MFVVPRQLRTRKGVSCGRLLFQRRYQFLVFPRLGKFSRSPQFLFLF